MPWSNTVKQRGCFSPEILTYGTSRNFPEKLKPLIPPPLYGVFKAGDPLKTGPNKCIGGRQGTTEEKYMEEREPMFPLSPHRPRLAKPWRNVSQPKSMVNTTTLNNFRNINMERSMRPY